MAKKEITMNMVMQVIEHNMTEYHNTVMDLFGTIGVKQMGSEPDIPQIIALKNDLHNIFKNIMEMEIVDAIDVPRLEETVHQKYGWLGTSYMEVAVICDADGHHVSAFNFPAWADVMRIFVRNILAIGTIRPSIPITPNNIWLYTENEYCAHPIVTTLCKKRILTRIRSNNGWFAYSEETGYHYGISTRTRNYRYVIPVNLRDVLKIRENISLMNLKVAADVKLGELPCHGRSNIDDITKRHIVCTTLKRLGVDVVE
nr:MAG TPA: hypothetical protein [Caudoviricetes sp.]